MNNPPRSKAMQPGKPLRGETFRTLLTTARSAAAPPLVGHATPESLDALRKEHGHLYEPFKLEFNLATAPAFTMEHALSKLEILGSGRFNSTYRVRLKTRDGTEVPGVFKPLRHTPSAWVGVMSGIPQEDPQPVLRNMTMRKYAERLGLRAVPGVQMGVLQITPIFGPQLGMVMDLAQGLPATKTSLEAIERGDVCQGVNDLQWLWHLTGAGDGRDGNIFIHAPPDDEAVVTGIDNDQCLGEALKDPNGIQEVKDDPARDGFNGTSMPPVIDARLGERILALEPGDIRELLDGKFNEAVVQAAQSLLEGTQQHVRALKDDGKFLSTPQDWADPRLQALHTPQNSLWGRMRQAARDRRAEEGPQATRPDAPPRD